MAGYSKYSQGRPYHVIAVCYAKFYDDMTRDIIFELDKKCETANCKMVIFSTCSDLSLGDRHVQSESSVFDAMQAERFDAIVIFSETFKDTETVPKIVRLAKQAEVPIISVDKYIEDCYNIEFSYGDSFEKIVRHVVEDHRLKRVNFIAGMEGNSFSEERLECYKRVLMDNNIPIEEERIGYGEFWEEPAKAAVDDFLSCGLELPQAIICANDIMAIAACQRLKEYGYRVPDDIIVTGFDGIEMEKYHSPRLTTATYNMDGLINQIFKVVNATSRHLVIPKDCKLSYIFKKSCSCGCSPIELVDSTDKFYQLAIKVKNNEYFEEQAYRMVSYLDNMGSLSDVFKGFEEYARTNDADQIWICTNEDMLDEHFDFDKAIKKRKRENASLFSDVMHIPMRKNHLKFFRGDKVERADIVPHFETVMQDHNTLFVFPLYAEEYTVGYMAACFDHLYAMRAKPFHSLIVNLMQVLTNYKVASERENYFNKDMLTNLYNRRGFYKYIKGVISEATEKQYAFAVISIDMDGLKIINDSYGHKEGDYALKSIATAMTLNVAEGEYAARFGGDEFLIALGASNAEERVDEIVGGIQGYLEELNKKHDKPYSLGASFGSYITVPKKDDNLDDYIRYADNAMYSEKARHKRERNR